RAEFERLETSLTGPNWLKAIRRAGIDRFLADGFPTTRWEDWRFTPVAPIADTEFRLAVQNGVSAEAAQASKSIFDDNACIRIALLNGAFDDRPSNLANAPAEIRVESLAEALRKGAESVQPYLARYAKIEQNPFVALNSAFFSDGVLIHIPKGA